MSYAFDTYRNEVMALARSMVIKFDFQNTLLNERLALTGEEISSDPRTWKYNMNLAGRYHRLDEQMKIISSDTQQEINYDLDTLSLHPRTSVEYGNGGAFFKELLDRFPKNKVLIKGIAKPVSIDKVVAAKDFEILSYREDLIAHNETLLIPRIQEWIFNFKSRWFNKDFAISDPLYPAAVLSILHMHLPQAIINIRQEYANTPFACQFDIWSYLGGHYELDSYRQYLSQDQAFWLYRNIRDIRSKAGRRDELVKLMHAMLKPRGVSLDKLEFIQEADTLLSAGHPISYFSFSDLEDKEVDYAAGNLLDTTGAFKKTEDLGLLNKEDLESDIANAERKLEATRENRLPTKLLRAYEDGSVVTQTAEKTQLKLDYIIYLAMLGQYNPDRIITFPDGDTQILSHKDLIILFLYASMKVTAIEGPGDKQIPEFALRRMVPQVPTDEAKLQYLVGGEITQADLDFTLSDPIDLSGVNTSAALDRLVEKVANKKRIQEYYWESKSTPLGMSRMQDLAAGAWVSHRGHLKAPGTTFSEWLSGTRIVDSNYKTQDWQNVAIEAFSLLLGTNGLDDSIAPAQKAMVDIVDRLSSYGIMFITEGGKAKEIRMEIPNTKISLVRGTVGYSYDIPCGLKIIESMTTASELARYEFMESNPITVRNTTVYRYGLSMGSDINYRQINKDHYQIPMADTQTSYEEV